MKSGTGRVEIVAILLCLFVALLFYAACGDDDPSESSGQADDSSEDATHPDDDTASTDDDIDDDSDDDDINDAVGETEDPDVPLCVQWEADPEELDDPVNIDCLIERGRFAEPVADLPDRIRVADWNIERGRHIDEFIDRFLNDAALSQADVILIQEADRRCARTDYRNVTRELAQALAMDYVYSVEFVELNQDRGEHGNAILSRFPIGDAAVIRLPNFERWWEDEEELRLGGRMSIRAEIMVGDTPLQLCSTHLTSGVWRYFTAHQEQTRATLEFLEDFDGPTIWGGDLNTGVFHIFNVEPSINLVFDYGYADVLDGLPPGETWTHPGDSPLLNARLDWIFYRGLPEGEGRVLYEENLSDLSDHLGIIADISLE